MFILLNLKGPFTLGITNTARQRQANCSWAVYDFWVFVVWRLWIMAYNYKMYPQTIPPVFWPFPLGQYPHPFTLSLAFAPHHSETGGSHRDVRACIIVLLILKFCQTDLSDRYINNKIAFSCKFNRINCILKWSRIRSRNVEAHFCNAGTISRLYVNDTTIYI